MNRSVLPWAVALVASAAAAVAVLSPRGDAPARTSEAACDPAELARLRRQVLAHENEARLLRAEMDRMRRLVAVKQKSDEVRAARGENELSDDEKRQRLDQALERLPGLAGRLMTGEREVYEGMRDVILAMVNAPHDDPAPFRRTWDAAGDPVVRRLVLPHIVASDAAGGRAFVLEELGRTADPELRADLLGTLRFATDVASDPEAQAALVSALGDESEPRARRQAAELLASVGTPEAEEALLRTAGGDGDEATRETAIRALARNPDTRDRVLEMASGLADERLRTVGECTARLAALESSG